MTDLIITRLKDIKNTLIIRKTKTSKFFIVAGNDSIIITTPNLAAIIKFLVMNNYMSHKVLEGILEDYYSNK